MADNAEPGPSRRLRLLCAEDHHIVREGICLIIARQPDMEVVAEASTGEEAVRLFRIHRPDITLMDLRLPRMSGVEAIRAIRSDDNNARIVVLTMYRNDDDIRRAIDAGAATYLLKSGLSDDLVRTIRELHAGQLPSNKVDPASLAEGTSQRLLSSREVQVLELVFVGMRNKEIGVSLGIAEDTVLVHLRNIYSKLNVHDRTAAVHIAVKRGILRVE